MDKFEKLVKEIMKECEEDGEPVTREEAEEMAKMEMGAKEIKNYTQASVEKKSKKPKERKVDNGKLEILKVLAKALENEMGVESQFENEVKLHFECGGNPYTITLTKHRPKK